MISFYGVASINNFVLQLRKKEFLNVFYYRLSVIVRDYTAVVIAGAIKIGNNITFYVNILVKIDIQDNSFVNGNV